MNGADLVAGLVVYVGMPLLALYWVTYGGRIRHPHIGATRYPSLDTLVEDLTATLGFASPIVMRAKWQNKLRIEGRIPGAQRRASVSFFARPSFLWKTSHVRFELEVDPAIRVSFRRGALGGLELGTDDHDRVERAFRNSPHLRRALDSAFRDFAVDHVMIWDGKLTATAKLGALALRDYPRLVALLDGVAASFEPVKLQVHVLGGERRALAGSQGEARCAFCHDRVTGEEPDLVACGRCGTVLHEECWSELGRCPVLGCTGTKPERGRATVR